MAHKSGLSHGLAVILTLVAAELLLSVIRPVFPAVLGPLERAIEGLTRWISGLLGASINPALAVPALIAMVLAFVWGLLYHGVRHGRD